MEDEQKLAPWLSYPVFEVDLLVALLTDEQIGSAVRAVHEYRKTGAIPSDNMEMAQCLYFERLRKAWDLSNGRYNKSVEGGKRGAEIRYKKQEENVEGEDSASACTAFRPPTVEEVAEYCASRQNNIDPQAFIDFYASKGWMVGKNKMRDWKAAVRTWEKKQEGRMPF